MKLAHEAEGQGQLLQTGDAILESGDIVRHLAKVFGTAIDRRSRFRSQKLPEGRLGALDPTGEHGLAANEGTDQESAGWGAGLPPRLDGRSPDRHPRETRMRRSPNSIFGGSGSGTKARYPSGVRIEPAAGLLGRMGSLRSR